MATQTQKNIAAKVFKVYPTAKEVHLTSDGSCWVGGGQNKNLADLHRKRIEDDALVTITREECAAEIKALVDAEKEATKKADATKKDLAYKQMNKAQLTEACAKRTPAIEMPEGSTNGDIVALLEADDAKQNS